MSTDELSLHLQRDVDVRQYEFTVSGSTTLDSLSVLDAILGAAGKLRMLSLWKGNQRSSLMS